MTLRILVIILSLSPAVSFGTASKSCRQHYYFDPQGSLAHSLLIKALQDKVISMGIPLTSFAAKKTLSDGALIEIIAAAKTYIYEIQASVSRVEKLEKQSVFMYTLSRQLGNNFRVAKSVFDNFNRKPAEGILDPTEGILFSIVESFDLKHLFITDFVNLTAVRVGLQLFEVEK